MKIVTAGMAAAATAVTAGVVGIASASLAAADVAADAGNTHTLGSQATLTNGDVVQGWTISDLKPSSDTIAYPVQGTLWEATATDVAIRGWVTPIVSDLNARSASGQTYRALYQVATPQGVNPATVAPGEKTSGKIYFDVTGDNPNSVVYNNVENRDLATWVEPPPSHGRAGSSATTAAAGGSAAPGAPAAPAPSGSQGTPVAPAAPPAGTPETPAAPAPPGSQGTPATPAAPPAGTQEAPGAVQGPEGTPATPAPPAGTQEAPATGPTTPAPPGPQEPPAGTPATPAPGGSQGTPAEGGSSAPAS